MADGHASCFCTSDVKCPHGISTKIPNQIDELEIIIDSVLRQFDRKTIKKYLKHNSFLENSSSSSNNKESINLTSLTNVNNTKNRGQLSEKLKKAYGQDLQSLIHNNNTLDKSNEVKKKLNNDAINPLRLARPMTSDQPTKRLHIDNKRKANDDIDTNNNNNHYNNDRKIRSKNQSMSKTLPALDHNPNFEEKNINMPTFSVNDDSRFDEHKNADLIVHMKASKLELPGSDRDGIEMPGDTGLSVGLMKIADVLSRKVLPWQAIVCPRAIETLRDIRVTLIQSRHVDFLSKMKKQVEDKVVLFIDKKNSEVYEWVEKEQLLWQQILFTQESNQNEFTESNNRRIDKRSMHQSAARQRRELGVASSSDGREREDTRLQLVKFRRLCRAENKNNTDIRALNENIEIAFNQASNVSDVTSRELFKRSEECHEWLCCLADNAITASDSEHTVKNLFTLLDKERDRGMASLNNAICKYKEQHEAILEAITIFHGKIHQHASDYLQREQLISRGFLQYILTLVSGEVNSHSNDQKRSSMAWEGKFAADRAFKKEQNFNRDYNLSLQAYDKLIGELKERMHYQHEHVIVTLQSVFNGRDTFLNQRKERIHKKLAKYVNKVCNNRRMQLKNLNTTRSDEYDLEKRSVTSLNKLTVTIRQQIDQIWIKQLLRERRMYEASNGRMERLEKSALIIWNRHSHLAISQKEEYNDWLSMYSKDRDIVTEERMQLISSEWGEWRSMFSLKVRKAIASLTEPISKFAVDECNYDLNVSMEINLETLANDTKSLKRSISNVLQEVRNSVDNFHSNEITQITTLTDLRVQMLLNEWEDNLKRLNNTINKRIAALKDMESDLEETIRLTLVQHESEASVFEQQSSSAIEEFWIDSRNQLENIGKDIIQASKEYEAYVETNKLKIKASTDSFSNESSSKKINITDSSRARKVLDEIKIEIYREFNTKVLRALEKVKLDCGQGRKRCIPPFLATRVLFQAMDWFWDAAKLSERCIGRVASRGVLLFREGLPASARSFFIVASAMMVLSQIKLNEDDLLDCEDILAILDGKGSKIVFLIGLLFLTQKLDSFGDRMLLLECIWGCSCFGVTPPDDMIEQYENSSKYGGAGCIAGGGFAHADPGDLINSVLVDPSEDEGIEDVANSDISSIRSEHKMKEQLVNLSQESYVYEISRNVSPLLPKSDWVVLLGVLGRNDGIIEISSSYVAQAVMLWRKVALVILGAVIEPAGSDYPQYSFLLQQHLAHHRIQKREGFAHISIISPFEAMTLSIDWITNFAGIPISFLQALGLIGRGGSCDPWLEDPHLSCRSGRFFYELKELLDSFYCRDTIGVMQRFLASFTPNLKECLKPFDINTSNTIPLELLRSFLHREDSILTCAQISSVFWCLSRISNDNWFNLHEHSASDSIQESTAFDGPVFTPISCPPIDTVFTGSVDEYMGSFSKDVGRFLDTMPSLDTNCIVGLPPYALTPAAANEVLLSAMKLDPSARNPIPSSCSLWLGAKVMNVNDAIAVVSNPEDKSTNTGGLMMTVGTSDVENKDKACVNLRMKIETDFLSIYPLHCTKRAADEDFQASENPLSDFDFLKELMHRRLERVDKLTLCWRDIMVNEWATSLYQSRQQRYAQRAVVVRNCISCYHKQYKKLKESIVQERSSLISKYRAFETELVVAGSNEKDFITFHTSFIDRSFRLAEEYLSASIGILSNVLGQFQRHCGSIRRIGLARIDQAEARVRASMDESCSGLILGYTAGYAKGHFDAMMYRGEILRKSVSTMHSQIIDEKESFIGVKDDLERDIICEVADRISVDRNRVKTFMDVLTADTIAMQELLGKTRASYVTLQKDANTRLIMRIENAIRESRKLRSAAEKNAEVEQVVLGEIATILENTKSTCKSIIGQIKSTCMDQLKSIYPLRAPHRDKMATRISTVRDNWTGLKNVLMPLIDNFESQNFERLQVMKSKAINFIGEYREMECASILADYKIEREALSSSFRDHFSRFHLGESGIFERFNKEISDAISEIKSNWGPSKPQFLRKAVSDTYSIAEEAMRGYTLDITKDLVELRSHGEGVGRWIIDEDNIVFKRYEVADILCHSLLDVYDVTATLPNRYLQEKEMILKEVHSKAMDIDGDIVGPQVHAIMDLLLAGIEIASDFEKGYMDLITATEVKCNDAILEVNDFVVKLSSTTVSSSIPASKNVILDRVMRRTEEVTSLLAAADAHLVADHTHFEVLLQTSEKDIEEWVMLTTQLVDNAFLNAGGNYLDPVWPTPPATPRLEILPDEEDRIAKLRALLKLNQESPEEMYSFKGKDLRSNRDEEFLKSKKSFLPASTAAITLLDSPRDHESFYPKPDFSLSTSPSIISDSFVELQNGWLECNDKGKIYYFNPATNQSLWDLPLEMKVKKLNPDKSLKMSGKAVNELNVTNEVVKDVLDEARSVAFNTSEIATEITSLIKSKDQYAIRSDVLEHTNNQDISGKSTSQAPIRPSRENAMSLHQSSITSIGSVEEDNFSLHSSALKEKGIYKIRIFGNDPLGILLHEDSIEIDNQKISFIKVGGIDILTLDGSQISSSANVLKFVRIDDILISINNETMINQSMEYAGSVLAPLKAAMETREFVFLNPNILSFEQYLKTPSEIIANEIDDDIDELSLEKSLQSFDDAEPDWNTSNLGHQLTSAGLNINIMDPKKIIEELNKSEVDPHEWMNKTKTKKVKKRVYEDDDSDYEGDDEIKKFKAEEKYRQTRENDFFFREDVLAKKVEAQIDVELGQLFGEKLQLITSVNHVTREEVRKLKQESYSLKKATVMKKLREMMITWEDLDTKVLDTEVAEIEARKLAESLKTEAGRERQRKLLEKQEDIEAMFDFFREIGIGKSTSRNAATEAILLKLDTAKKLAKVWKRGDITLNSLGLDSDEVEEVEANLNMMLTQGAKEKNALSRTNSRPSTTMSRKSTPVTESYTVPQSPSVTASEGLGFGVDQVIDDSMYEYGEAPSAYSTDYQSNDDLSSYKNDDHQQGLPHYKSYRGDWIEGYSPEGHLYYYNTFTGESSWTLPAGIERGPSPGTFSRRNTGLSRKESGLLTYQEDEWGSEEQSLADYDWTQATNVQPNYDDANTNTIFEDKNVSSQEMKSESSVKPPSPAVAAATSSKAATPTNAKKRKDSYFSFLGKKEEEVLLPKPRSLPIPTLPEVTGYSKGEGISRQARLLEAQERWHKGLELLNSIIVREQETYFSKKKQMFEKVTTNIESRLGILVDDIKFMQRTLKKELAVMNANQSDLRRLLEEDSVNVIMAEKLSYILDGLEKLKINLASNYESAFRQMDKFIYDWNFLRTELLQTGVVYDDVTLANLDKVRTNTEHQIKVFAFHQINNTTVFKKNELRILRIHFRKALLSDTMAAQESRSKVRQRQLKAFHDREVRKNELIIEYKGREGMIEPILNKENLLKLDVDKEMRPEEEILMSFMLSQIEMEIALTDDYDAIIEASKTTSQKFQKQTKDYDAEQKQNSLIEGSWFNKHRDTISRHDSALTQTLQKVRTKVRDGYTILNAKIEALDFDVEHAAEVEIEGRNNNDNFLEP